MLITLYAYNHMKIAFALAIALITLKHYIGACYINACYTHVNQKTMQNPYSTFNLLIIQT